MPSIRTLEREFRHEIAKIKGSRFIATLAPATDEAACEAVVARVRAEYPDARHHCWAWRLGHGRDLFRYNDDGEPSGSAGRPILQAIDGRALTDVIAVVTRYFGGTKLGVGGLVRAYGGCVAEALDRAKVATVRITKTLRVEYAYELSAPVSAVLAATADLTVLESAYGATTVVRVAVPEEAADAFVADLMERTAGRVSVGPPPDSPSD